MAQPLPTYLRSYRRKWALTQCELAELLGGISPSTISKYETLARTPSAEVMLALEMIFEEAPSAIFPALSQSARRMVLRNAVVLQDRLAEKHDARSVRKRCLLDAMITRSQKNHEENS